ncbi:MAG: RES family NAD+ phosphorylase [Acidisphaera sp.]|nr:RES family NAD+ phosphorylase [Acidisphaera sp.]
MAAKLGPPAGFASRRLLIHREKVGRLWRRLYQTRHPDPLGSRPAHSRFSHPSGTAFGVVYLGSSVKVAFHEVILRDRADARSGAVLIPYAELEAYTCAEIIAVSELRLVDLTGDAPLKMGVPSDVAGARDQTLARQWSAAFHTHPDRVDGVYYPSRLNEERNIALYDRALAKLTVRATSRLLDLRDPLTQIIEDFQLEVR